MRVGIAQARERFKEMLERARAGEVVEITRRGEVVAVLAPPPAAHGSPQSFADELREWRAIWQVDSWPDEDVFVDVRSREPGRQAPW
jgi:prevent-host-death family protein